MSIRLALKEWQIALLEIQAAGTDPESVHISSRAARSLGGIDPVAFAESKRRWQRRDYQRLLAHIRYLKRRHYLEKIQEGDKRLYRLTAKGKYEILRLRFVEHMMKAREKKWDRAWRILIFDIPEWMHKYRDFMRRLLKDNGFQMWQFSVWVTKYDPEPALRDLLKHLGLHKYYSIIEADCKKCSPRLVKTWHQMQRTKETPREGKSKYYRQ